MTDFIPKEQRTTKKIKQYEVYRLNEVKLPKPSWLKVRIPANALKVKEVRELLADKGMHTVCQEANCPNLNECFNKKRATFLLMGQICTRRCPFCDVAHGKPLPLDPKEADHIVESIKRLGIKFVVLTSVDRDDLKDGGASHFVHCVKKIQTETDAKVEILIPDFRGRLERALEVLKEIKPNVLNHNIETVPRLYREVKPGGNYEHSLTLLKRWSEIYPDCPTKSGLMVGLGETDEEIIQVLKDLRANNVQMVTIGQYLAPSKYHYPVQRYVDPDTFKKYAQTAKELGFSSCASGALIRSSYGAAEQTSEFNQLLNDGQNI